MQTCKVTPGELDARPSCPQPAQVDALDLAEKWRYTNPLATAIVAPPIVANLNDDNGDGAIDLCDTPDVLVERRVADESPERIQFEVLSGKDGSWEWEIDPGNLAYPTPAIVDLDADGVPEILAANLNGHVIALSPAGAVLWEGSAEVFDATGISGLNPTTGSILRELYVYGTSISAMDIDGDGIPEILVGMSVLDNHGNLLFQDPTQGSEFGLNSYVAVRPIAADLDGTGILDVIFGHVGYRADGTVFYHLDTTPGFSAVGNFIGHTFSQILVTSEEGMTLVSSDGETLWGPIQLGDSPPATEDCWVHPAAAVDIDGDGVSEALVNTCTRRLVLELGVTGPTILASAPLPGSGSNIGWLSGSTAFDFGESGPDWIAYHTSFGLTVFDGAGPASLTALTDSTNNGPYFPVVADVDNNGSTDILLLGPDASGAPNVLIAYEDSQHRPSPGRRIWNQWNYVPSAVREDAVLASGHPSQGFRVQSKLACDGN